MLQNRSCPQWPTVLPGKYPSGYLCQWLIGEVDQRDRGRELPYFYLIYRSYWLRVLTLSMPAFSFA